jgi:hypothetical protein
MYPSPFCNTQVVYPDWHVVTALVHVFAVVKVLTLPQNFPMVERHFAAVGVAVAVVLVVAEVVVVAGGLEVVTSALVLVLEIIATGRDVVEVVGVVPADGVRYQFV